MSMRSIAAAAAAALAVLLIDVPLHAAPAARSDIALERASVPATPDTSEPNVARRWNEATLDAIRIDIPKPTVHSRNLFHVSIALYDAWAAYDDTARGYLVREKHTADDVEAARAEAMSHAAYHVLKYRYRYGPGEDASQQAFDDLMDDLGHDRTMVSTDGDSPAALGNRIAAAIVEFGHGDGANEGPYMDYADDTGYFPYNPPLVFEFPGTIMWFPNRWQPLAFDYLILQNGIVIGQAIQEFINPNWGKVTPFALTPDQVTADWVYLDPGMPPQLGGEGDEAFKAGALEVIRFSSWQDPTDGVRIDASPGAIGNIPLGGYEAEGHPINPYTRRPYEPNMMLRGDFGRVMAEFWADGPDSETPPGHWNVLVHQVADHPLTIKRLAGSGPVMDDVEWEVKLYLALNGAMHDAAVAAWGIKGHYDYSRPISQIRYLSQFGQSSDPGLPSYSPNGIPLEDGLVELITFASSARGERHAHLATYVGEIAVRSWQGTPEDQANEIGGVGWILGTRWTPYQQSTFVTPAFAGYISGHSTFSRAGAEVLTAFTGSPFFPGGYSSFVAEANEYLVFEDGPSETVELQFATYYDAADMAGVSRLWGGIHPRADDLPGRIIGSRIGIASWELAQRYYGELPSKICVVPSTSGGRGRSTSASGASLRGLLDDGTASIGACPSGDPGVPTIDFGRN